MPRKKPLKNVQPFYGEAQLLSTMAGVALTEEDYEAIRLAVHRALSKRHGSECVVMIEIQGAEGEWGDPSDLL